MEIETSGLSVDKDAHGPEENTSRCTKKYRGRTSFFFFWRQDFFGGPVVKTLHFHCKLHSFNPWLGSKITLAMQHDRNF